MKKFSATGFTVASVLGIALLGGVAGGALVLGDDGSEAAAPRPVQMGLKVAEEATTAPTVTPSATPTAVPTMETPAAPAPVQAPATQEEPVASTPTKNETAKEAADRAEKAAQRAEDAAQKAETVATTPPAPAPSPTPAPAPPAPDGPKACSGERPSPDHVCDTKAGEWKYQAPVLAPEFNEFGHATPCRGAGSKPARGYRCLQHADGSNEWALPES